MDRYHRQTLLPQIKPAGQHRLANARVVIVGCGALGCMAADQLARAGIGHLTLIDRDIVEWTNLQRQILFDETDARAAAPKAVAAARRLAAINSSIKVDPVVADVHSGNIGQLIAADSTLILDGLDNAAARYLLNDFAVAKSIPWVYAGCVGVEGRVLSIRPGETPCLRCLFPQPPSTGELPTCDTAGVLGPAVTAIAALQAAAAIRLLVDDVIAADHSLISMNVWTQQCRSIAAVERDPDCPCCQKHAFVFLNQSVELTGGQLCGRNAVQIRSLHTNRLQLPDLARRLALAGRVESSTFMLRCHLLEDPTITLTVFPDARTIVQGTTDIARANALVDRYIGR